MKCPDCESGTIVAYFARMTDGSCKPRVELTCPRCDGTAEVPGDMAQWIETGKRLRAKRLSLKLGLRQAAELMGIAPSYLSYAEQGKRGIPPKCVDILRDIYAVTDLIERLERTVRHAS